MKKTFLFFTIASIAIATVNTKAQTWSTPIVVGAVSGAGTGQYASMKIIDGNPAISYYDQTNQNLKYVRASNSSGTAWGSSVTIDSIGDVGTHISLQIVNGNPAISYHDGGNGDLKYVRANDMAGTSWGSPITLHGTGGIGWYTSLQIVNGNPAIAYCNVTDGDLTYIRANDASGTAWDAPVTIDGGIYTVGFHNSLQIVNGKPAISYYDHDNASLKYVRASDSSGTAWDTPIVLDASGFTGEYTSLRVVNGKPAISYYNAFNWDLKYIRATDSSGTAWSSPITLDVNGFVGYFTSLEIINGHPAISYYDLTNGDLKYIRSTDPSGTSWNPSVMVHSINGYVGEYTSMIPIGIEAGIAYYSPTDSSLYFVRSCTAASTPILSTSSAAICAGASTTLNVDFGDLNTASNWQWYSTSCGGTSIGSGMNVTVSPTTTTTYYARGEGGCGNGPCASITITVNSASSSSQTEAACKSYTWSVNNMSYNTSGTYTTTLTNVSGCDSTIILYLTINNVDVSTSLNGEIITANNSNGFYQWIDCSNNTFINGETNQSYTATANGSYAVIVINDFDACVDTSACVNITTVGIRNYDSKITNFEISPNPNNGAFILQTLNQELGAIEVRNALGEIVYLENIKTPKSEIRLPQLSNGIYYLSVNNKGHIKMILQN